MSGSTHSVDLNAMEQESRSQMLDATVIDDIVRTSSTDVANLHAVALTTDAGSSLEATFLELQGAFTGVTEAVNELATTLADISNGYRQMTEELVRIFK